MPDTFKQTLGIGTAGAPTAPPAGVIGAPTKPPGFPKPIPRPAPMPRPAPPPAKLPLPAPDKLAPPFNVKGELEPGIPPFIVTASLASLEWDAPAIQPQNTTYEIYCERDNITRIPSEAPATEPELYAIVVHTQGATHYKQIVSTGRKNLPLRVGESVRYYVVSRCDNGTLTPTYRPNLFGIKIFLPRRM